MCEDEVRGKLEEFKQQFAERSKPLSTTALMRNFAKPLLDAVTLLIRNTGTSKVQQEILEDNMALWAGAQREVAKTSTTDSPSIVAAVMKAVEDRFARSELAAQNSCITERREMDEKMELLHTVIDFNAYVDHNDARVTKLCDLLGALEKAGADAKEDVKNTVLLPELDSLTPVTNLDSMWRQTQIRLVQAIMTGSESSIGDIHGMLIFAVFVSGQEGDFPKPTAKMITNMEQMIVSNNLQRLRRLELWNFIAPMITSSEAVDFKEFVLNRVMTGEEKQREVWECFKFKTFGNAERARKTDSDLKRRREAKKATMASMGAPGSLVYKKGSTGSAAGPTTSASLTRSLMTPRTTPNLLPPKLAEAALRKRKRPSTLMPTSLAAPTTDFAKELRDISQSKWAETRALQHAMVGDDEEDEDYEDENAEDSNDD